MNVFTLPLHEPFHIWNVDEDPDDASRVYYDAGRRHPICGFDVATALDDLDVDRDSSGVRLIPVKHHVSDFDSLGEFLTDDRRCPRCAQRVAERSGLLDWRAVHRSHRSSGTPTCDECGSVADVVRLKGYVSTVDEDEQRPLGERDQYLCATCDDEVLKEVGTDASPARYVSERTEP